MFLELLGLGILAILGSSKREPTLTSSHLGTKEKAKSNKNIQSEEVAESEKRIDVNKVQLKKNSICINEENSISFELYYSDIIDIPTVSEENSNLTITIKDNNDTYLLIFKEGGISLDDFQVIQKKVISSISAKLHEFHKLAYNEYLRDTSIENIGIKLENITSNFNHSKEFWETKFNKEEIHQLSDLDEFLPLVKGQKKLREIFESKALIERERFFDKIETNPLTEHQRLAVVRNNDLNLVLAAAGTGKTSVIVSKALNLIDSNHANSKDILILAYNNSASKELQNRILSRGSSIKQSEHNCPTVSTFHALGKKILQDSNLPSYISVFAEDKIKLEMWATQWLTNYITSSPSSLKEFIELSYQPLNPFDFGTKEEYDAYIRDNEYRTLQGERVKGYQELLIANWFFLNGVEYEYEEPYVSKRRIEIGFDYRPDFHFKNTAIYLEHFGIDRNKNTRKGIDPIEYNKSIGDKRKLHQECQTTLLETFHYNWLENKLENKLSKLVLKVGITLKPKSPEEIFKTLNEMGLIEKSAKRYLKTLSAIRVESLDDESISKRLIEHNIVNANQYTKLLSELHQSYKDELKDQKRIDFDDMIIKSTEAIISGKFKPCWTHILVDEFQDISMARMDFLKALIAYGPTPILTVVGDDWQSIYRFSGGKLELTTRIGEILGTHSITKLEKTFRYSSSIADVAGTFIMKNPEQYVKNVTTQRQDKKSQVYLLDSEVGDENNLEHRVRQVVQTIRKHDNKGSIAVLARYNYLLNNVRKTLKSARLMSNVQCWTFHRSKGLETDYCILIGFFQGKTGFPNQNKEDVVTEALLPTLDDFPHSEERRLLYVAITRARKKSYLIADPMAPSEFINEILSTQYNLHIDSERFEEKFRKIYKCHLCTDGYFKMQSGKYGNFYSCTSGSICKSKPRICEKCGSPSLDTHNRSICNDENCRNAKIICDRCGRPMKIREGKFGKFLGCSGYGIKNDQCKNTKQLY